MNPKISIYRYGELVCETNGVPGESLLKRIGAAGVFLDSPCGGKGKCGKCLVRLSPGGEKVCACRISVEGDMSVYLPEDMEMKIAGAGGQYPHNAECRMENAEIGDGSYEVGSADTPEFRIPNLISGAARRVGVAVDIGTTTVVAHLIDLDTSIRIATASGVNAQRTYGADVISRIQYCSDNGHDTLTRLIREQLSSLILEACAASGTCANDIGYIAIAANTIMEHLAAGYSPVGMGAVPFTPVSLFGEEMSAWDNLPVSKTAKVYFAPAVSSYVGSDITAGMYAAKLEGTSCPAVYLDIGTNGEIVLKSGDTYYCCATAAGPAFEGAEITMGMAAINGAINHVKWDDGLKYTIIGGGAPRGLCGSGLLDALAVLLETGAVDETGRMLGINDIEHNIADCIGEVDGKNGFWLTRDDGGVYMSASDIRKLQLAKSAIAAGIQTLLRYTEISEEQVGLFVLAGGFGSFMDQYSAARIGLFPKIFLPVSQTLGNTAGEGAALALCSEAARASLNSIRARCKYIELSANPIFNEQFMEQMMFP